MNGVIEFLRGIGEAIGNVTDFIVSFFSDIVYMITMLGKIAVEIPTYFSWLPSYITTPLLLIFTLVILYKILGREG